MNEVFPDKYKEPLQGLLYLGRITSNETVAGHEFEIKTLTTGEIMRVGELIKKYRGTVSENIAHKLYTVAAAVMTVDGQPITKDYKEDYDFIRENAEVVKKWYPAVVNTLYNKYTDLETTAVEVTNALKK